MASRHFAEDIAVAPGPRERESRVLSPIRLGQALLARRRLGTNHISDTAA